MATDCTHDSNVLWEDFRQAPDATLGHPVIAPVFEACHSTAVCVAHAILRDRHLAEDAFNEALKRLLTRRKRIASFEQAVRWVHSATRYCARELARERKKHGVSGSVSVLCQTLPARDDDAVERREKDEVMAEATSTIRDAVSDLAPELKAVVDAHLIGLSQSKAAPQLGCDKRTVAYRYKKAVQALREVLADRLPRWESVLAVAGATLALCRTATAGVIRGTWAVVTRGGLARRALLAGGACALVAVGARAFWLRPADRIEPPGPQTALAAQPVIHAAVEPTLAEKAVAVWPQLQERLGKRPFTASGTVTPAAHDYIRVVDRMVTFTAEVQSSSVHGGRATVIIEYNVDTCLGSLRVRHLGATATHADADVALGGGTGRTFSAPVREKGAPAQKEPERTSHLYEAENAPEQLFAILSQLSPPGALERAARPRPATPGLLPAPARPPVSDD